MTYDVRMLCGERVVLWRGVRWRRDEDAVGEEEEGGDEEEVEGVAEGHGGGGVGEDACSGSGALVTRAAERRSAVAARRVVSVFFRFSITYHPSDLRVLLSIVSIPHVRRHYRHLR